MTRVLASLSEVASGYDAIVFDQWGVLHDGSTPYPKAPSTIEALAKAGHRLAVLSNSSRRAEANRAQLRDFGFEPTLFDCVMTSGEALWRAFAQGEIAYSRVHAITRTDGAAEAWGAGLDIEFLPVADADAVLLMGLGDDTPPGTYDDVLAVALARGLPVLCSNPDRTAPRPGGVMVVMPGTLAHQHAANGGEVRFIGKPHAPIFRAVEAALDLAPDRILMVGDSLEHDIAGADAAGWDSAFICSGLHAAHFLTGDCSDNVAALADAMDAPIPTYTLDTLR